MEHESDDLPVQDLLGVGQGPGPGPDELRAIVARAGRRRWRYAGAGVVLALVVGGLSGYAFSNHSSPSNQTAISPAASPTTLPGGSTGYAPLTAQSASGAAGVAPAAETPFTHLFTRTAGPVTIRGFLTNFPLPEPSGVAAQCDLGPPRFQAEVSTSQMVGLASGPFGAAVGKAIEDNSSQLVGTQERDPVAVVTAEVGSAVRQVRVAFVGGATDQMAPVDGWVALAAPVSSKLSYGNTLGTLTVFGADGQALATLRLTLGSGGPVLTPQVCGVPACVNASPAVTIPGGLPSTQTSCTTCPAVPHAGQSSINPGGPMLTVPTTGNSSAGGSVNSVCATSSSRTSPPTTFVAPSATVGGG